MVRLGYNSNGFQSHRLDEALVWLAELGYRSVALTPDVPHLDPATTSAQELEAVARRCRELGLAVVVETGARYVLDPRRKHRPNLLEVDAADDTRLRFLLQMLDWCEALGAPVLSFWSGSLPEGQTPDGAQARLLDALARLAPVAERRGVALGLEPEPGHFIATVADWRRLARHFDGPLDMTLDVGHLLVDKEGPLLEVVDPVEQHVVNVQLADMRVGVHEHLAPGEGQVDWDAVRSLLGRLPDDVPACFELSRDSHRFHILAPRLISEFAELL